MTSHSSQSIRYHSPSDTYIISKKSYYEKDILINGNVMVGPGVHFWKNVKIKGNAQFGKGCVIEGCLNAENVLLGSQSVVKGPIHVSGDISLFQNVTVQSIECGSSVILMEGCTADYINSKRLEIIGKAQVKKIGSITKKTVKADNLSCRNDSEEQDIEFSELEILPERVSELEILLEHVSELEILPEHVSEIEISDENNSHPQITPLQQISDQLTPQFPVENTKDDAEFIINGYPKPKLSEIAAVPQDEMLDVELISYDEAEDETLKFQTIETPFGTVVVGDNSNTRPVSKSTPDPTDLANPVDPTDPASISQISSSPQASSPKRKPYPDFAPMAVPAEKHTHSSPSKSSQSKISQTTNSSQTANRGEEIKNQPEPKNKSAPSKVVFEDLFLTAKIEETEIKNIEKSAEETETERSNSKLWYEERVKPTQKVSKKYPPYF